MAGFFDDINDDLNGGSAPSPRDRDAEIRKNAHIVNGGEATFPCPKCSGSGRFVSFSGRAGGPCFACKGSGKTTQSRVKAQQAHKKGVATKARNVLEKRIAFTNAHPDVMETLRAASDWSSWAASLLEQIVDRGELSEKQIAAVRSMAEKQAARKAEKDAAKAANSGTVDVSAIEALFGTAKGNGLKRPIFRTEHVVVSLAPATGRNAGSLYVKYDGEYAGKITDGKYYATSAAPVDTLSILQRIAKDPAGEATLYGQKTGICGCCGAELTNAESIRLGIGPICRSKWGL